jgi:hypothetical protein
MSGFPFFAIFVNRLSSILFTRSLHARLLFLAHDGLESRSCCGCLRCKFHLAECMLEIIEAIKINILYHLNKKKVNGGIRNINYYE